MNFAARIHDLPHADHRKLGAECRAVTVLLRICVGSILPSVAGYSLEDFQIIVGHIPKSKPSVTIHTYTHLKR